MPELPEVELIRRKLVGWLDKTCVIFDAEVVRQNGKYLPGNEIDSLKSCVICDITRKGKLLTFELGLGGKIVCHNAMSGYWDVDDDPWTFDYVEGKRSSKESDVRIKFFLGEPGGEKYTRILRFHDARLFGSVRFYESGSDAPSLNRLGPDALEELTLDQLDRICQSSCRPIKQVLMDQRKISGIGNIYASEILWRTSLRPDLPARQLFGPPERLYLNIRSVLQEALDRNVDYKSLSVYRRKYCPECGGVIKKIEIVKRSTYMCERCQP